MRKNIIAAGVLGALFLSAMAWGQTVTVPQVQQINPADLFQDVVNGQPQAGNYYAPAAMIGTYGQTLAGALNGNALIGGDFSTNLFQRGTAPSTVTTTATYIADRWFTWGGSSSTITATQQTGASDITTGSNASLRINRAGNGLTQVCVAQVVETVNALPFQGQTAEFDFVAKAGSTFSAASSNLAIYILTGTSSDEGSSKAAFSINAGGGGAAGYTGASLLGGTNGYLVAISSAGFNRVSVVAPIAATAKEITVAICYTPVGNGASTDWFEFTQAQLVINPALTSVAGTAGVALSLNDVRAKAFQFRNTGVETSLQQRYYFQINETATLFVASGVATGSAVEHAVMTLPSTMRTTPTCTITAGTFKWIGKAAGAVSNPGCASTSAVGEILHISDTESGNTAGDAIMLEGTGTTGIIAISAEL